MPTGRSHRILAALRSAVPIACVAVVAVCLGSCSATDAVPGADARGPKLLDRLPASAPGWLQVSTDPSSKAWRDLAAAAGLGASRAEVEGVLAVATDEVLGAEKPGPTDWNDDVAPWIGSEFGLALTTADIDAPEALVGWANIRDVGRLERTLRDRGWRETGSDESVQGVRPWLPPSDASGTLPYIGVSDDILLAASDRDSLAAVVDAAASRSVATDLEPLGEFVDTPPPDPVSVFVRGSMLRQTVAIRAGETPASYQAVKTFVETPWVLAAKSAIFNISGAGKRVRVDGRSLYRGLELGQRLLDTVDLDVLGELPADTSLGVALEDPGILLDGIANTAQRGGQEFTTNEDHPGTGKVARLADVFNMLDGDASVGWLRARTGGASRRFEAVVRDDPETDEPSSAERDRTIAALRGLVGPIAAALGMTVDVVTSPASEDELASTRFKVAPATESVAPRDTGTLADDPIWKSTWKALDPPSAPVGLAWLGADAWAECGGPVADLDVPWFGTDIAISSRLDGPVASWIDWSDDTGELTFGTEFELGPRRTDCTTAPVGEQRPGKRPVQ